MAKLKLIDFKDSKNIQCLAGFMCNQKEYITLPLIKSFIRNLPNNRIFKLHRGYDPFYFSIRYNKPDIFMYLIKLNGIIQTTYKNSNTLILACKYTQSKEILEHILKKRTNPNVIEDNWSPISILTYKGASLKMIQLLCEHKANLNITPHNPLHNLVYHHVYNTKTIEYLLEQKADPNIKDGDGNTTLHIVLNRYTDYSIVPTIQLLLDYKADPNVENNSNYKSLDIAMGKNSHIGIIELLIRYSKFTSEQILYFAKNPKILLRIA